MVKSKLLLSLAVLLSITVSGLTQTSAASADEVKWSRADIPAEGNAGNWLLANGSDIQHLTMSAGGTLYAYAEGPGYTLYQSTDGGYSWSYIGDVQDSIVECSVCSKRVMSC
jgi:hypothetical protein